MTGIKQPADQAQLRCSIKECDCIFLKDDIPSKQVKSKMEIT